jgi:hypothetical protein
MAYEVGDIAKELTIALINKLQFPIHGDRLANAQWVGDTYKTIYKAVAKPDAPIEED